MTTTTENLPQGTLVTLPYRPDTEIYRTISDILWDVTAKKSFVQLELIVNTKLTRAAYVNRLEIYKLGGF